MKEILVINPKSKKKRDKKTRSKAKGAFKMSEKQNKSNPKRKKRNDPDPNPKKKKRNPDWRGYASRARSGFMGLNWKRVVQDIPWNQAGMWAAKWAAKKWGAEESLANVAEPESWVLSSYVKGGIGTTIMAFLVNLLKPGAGQAVLNGGLNLMTFFAIRNEIIEGNEWATTQFGQQEPISLPESVDDMVYEGDDGPYFPGPDNEFYPADERHRLPDFAFSGELEPVGPLGESLEPIGPLGQDPYVKAWHRNA